MTQITVTLTATLDVSKLPALLALLTGSEPQVAITAPAAEAPAAFSGFAPRSFDRILVGGSGGNLSAILEALPGLLRDSGRLVCNTACLETTAKVAAALRRPPWSGFACSQVSVARGVPAGPLLRFDALNPVWVTSADLEDAT